MKPKIPCKPKEGLRRIESKEHEQIEPWQPLFVNNETLLYHLGRIKVHDRYEPQIYRLAVKEAPNRLIQQ